MPLRHGLPYLKRNARHNKRALLEPLIQIRRCNPLQCLPRKGNAAPGGIAAKNLWCDDSCVTHLIQHSGLDGEMTVFLGSILGSHKHCRAIHLGIPCEMIALAGSWLQIDFLGVEVTMQFLAKLRFDLRISFAMRLRSVKRRWSITLPVVDVSTAHGQASGVRRFHQEARRPPMMFCITPLKTPAAAASGMAAKCSRASDAAMPPFCMPTSMLTVRATDSG